MSLDLKVSTSFKHTIDFVRDRVLSNLKEARGLGKFNIPDRDFEAICNLVSMSFDQGSTIAFKEIEGLIKELKKDYGS
jgi:hypothetical protein